MFKKISLLISVALPLSISYSFAVLECVTFDDTETQGHRHVRVVWKDSETSQQFILESAGEESYYRYVKTLRSLPIKEAYPPVEESFERFNFQNLDRQKTKNPYHLYTLSYQGKEVEKTSLGFVQLGRMTTLGYTEGTEENPKAHHEILKKWMELGITKQKNEKEGLKGDNFERIENRGLAMILPLFNPEVQKEHKVSSIEACYKLVCKLTIQKDLLHVEKTLPHYVVSLFSPDDENIENFERNGFEKDANPGFGWFYPKDRKPQPRTMVTRLVEI